MEVPQLSVLHLLDLLMPYFLALARAGGIPSIPPKGRTETGKKIPPSIYTPILKKVGFLSNTRKGFRFWELIDARTDCELVPSTPTCNVTSSTIATTTYSSKSGPTTQHDDEEHHTLAPILYSPTTDGKGAKNWGKDMDSLQRDWIQGYQIQQQLMMMQYMGGGMGGVPPMPDYKWKAPLSHVLLTFDPLVKPQLDVVIDYLRTMPAPVAVHVSLQPDASRFEKSHKLVAQDVLGHSISDDSFPQAAELLLHDPPERSEEAANRNTDAVFAAATKQSLSCYLSRIRAVVARAFYALLSLGPDIVKRRKRAQLFLRDLQQNELFQKNVAGYLQLEQKKSASMHPMMRLQLMMSGEDPDIPLGGENSLGGARLKLSSVPDCVGVRSVSKMMEETESSTYAVTK